MSTVSPLPTVYEEDEEKQEDLDMEDPPAAEAAAVALAIDDLQNSGADHSVGAGGQTASPVVTLRHFAGVGGCQAH